MEDCRGLMIQAPCGSGKTWYINQLGVTKYQLLDGDVLLNTHHVSNKNIYWYQNE